MAGEMELYKPAILARETVIGLTGCLLRNHVGLHPEAEYPAMINPRPADWNCETKFATDAVQVHLNYEPQKDAATEAE